MAGLFNLAAQQAMSTLPRPVRMVQGGGLSSVQKRMNIGGQPHRLAYITTKEEDLLRKLGGSGRPVNGIPAYYMGEDFGQGWSEAEADAADSAMGMSDWDADQFDTGSGIADYTIEHDPPSGYANDWDWLGGLRGEVDEELGGRAMGKSWGFHEGEDKEGTYEVPSGDPHPFVEGLSWLVSPITTAWRAYLRTTPEYEAKMTTYDAILKSMFTTPEQKEEAARMKDEVQQERYGVYSRAGRAEYDAMAQMETNPEVERAKRQVERQDEKEEEEKKGLMAQLFSMMKDEKEEDKETRYDPWKLQLEQAYGPNWREKIEGSTYV